MSPLSKSRRRHLRIAESLAGLWLAALLATGHAAPPDDALLRRGTYLVNAFGCADCHTPHTPGPKGPVPDAARGLSGHPQNAALPPAPPARGPWLWGGAATNTAFWGPWGVSFASNLTPDPNTGIGSWTPEQFVQAVRQGRHAGSGRPLLPPMPWHAIGQLDDRDLQAIFSHLRAQPAVVNAVPVPLPPAKR